MKDPKAPMSRAVVAGIGVFAVGFAVGPYAGGQGPWVDVVVPTIAGFAAAWFAPRRRILVGASMAAPPALLFVAGQTYCDLTGARCDHIGVGGTIALGFFTLAWNLLFCASGAAAAELAQRWVRSQSADEP